MSIYSDDSPIIACSSGGNSNAAIAIIRISGFKSLSDFQKAFTVNLSSLRPRYAYFTKVINEDLLLDEIVLTYFKGPNSYNGENILELSVHGNIFNIERILNYFIDNFKLRSAYPGEFSYRALKNKKLSLTQVEGLDLLLNASSPFSLKQGFSLLSGKLQDDYKNLYDKFLKHKSSVELSIDFLDDIGEEASEIQLKDSFKELYSAINNLSKRIDTNSANLISPDIVLVGQPNAGKSSLFNQLLSDNRAIVSEIAGTTRDYITEKIKLNDTLYNLIDTAGLRDSEDSIESEGIRRSYSLIDNSFFKILLINPLDFNSNFLKTISNYTFDLIIFTHKDMETYPKAFNSALSELSKYFGPMGAVSKSGPIEPNNSGPMGADENSGSIGPKFVEISLVDEELKDSSLIIDYINNKYLSVIGKEPIIVDRHIQVINNISLQINDYSRILDNISDISIISSELNIVGHCISELIGIISPDDVLHNIFDNFCIGK